MAPPVSYSPDGLAQADVQLRSEDADRRVGSARADDARRIATAEPQLAERLALDVVDALCADAPGKGPRVLHPIARNQLAEMFANIVRARVPFQPPLQSSELTRAQGELVQTGFSHLGELLTPEQVADIRRHLEPHPVFNRWMAEVSDGVPHALEGAGRESLFGSYARSVILSAPHLLDLAVHPWVQTLVEHYLGCPSTLTSMNVWWSFAGHQVSQLGNSQDFHRDTEAYRSCVVFLYLSDVTLQSGAHCYIQRSHSLEAVTALFAERGIRMLRSELAQDMRYAQDLNSAFRPDALVCDQDRPLEPIDLFMLSVDGYGGGQVYMKIFKDLLAAVVGPAGTAFAADTYGLHAGLPPIEQNRLCVWLRYAVDPMYPAKPVDPGLEQLVFGGRVPDTPRNRFLLRHVITQ